MEWPWRRRARREAELAEEIRAHMRMAIDDRIARGESPADAVRAARREFGSEMEVREVTRAMWGGQWWERLRQDVRYALRSLRRTPSFTFAAVATLALGIGANTAVFTVVRGVLLRPLSFPEPEQLVLVSHGRPPGPFVPTAGMWDGDYLALRERAVGFDALATFSNQPVALTGAGEPLRLNAAVVTPDFFRALGVAQAVGRGFQSEDVAAGGVVVLGDALWRSRFAADASIVGRTVVLDGVARTVIGVMPPGFDFPNRAELWLPFEVVLDPNNGRSRTVIGRLGRDVSLARARAAFMTFVASLPPPDGAVESRVQPLKEYMVGRARHTLLVFAGAVAFVLLIACANVANLLLMRGAGRARELTVRTALGAGRGRLLRQLLTESVVLSLLGGGAGVLLAYGGVEALLAVAPAGRIPRGDAIRVDGLVLSATAGVSLLAGLAFGLLPSLYATRRDLRGALLTAGRAPLRDRGRIRAVLALGQIALALVLLTGAGLLLRSFRNMRAVDLGFLPTHTLTMTVDLPAADYADVATMRALHDRVLTRLAAIPGVDAAGAVNWRPFSQMLLSGDFAVENGSALTSGYSDKIAVSPGYFRAMGIRVLGGRTFTEADRAGATGVVVVSRTLADRFWPDGDAVGKRISMSGDPGRPDWVTVVGVVDAVVQQEVTGDRHAAIYSPIAQVTTPFFLSHMTYVVRSRAPAGVAAAMRAAVRTADPNLPVHTVASMDALLADVTSEPRFQTGLLATFSLIALVLAAVGVYGVLAYGVAQRRFEIGLRMALGARAFDVVGAVLRSSLELAAAGVVLGVLGAVFLTRLLRGYLFGVSPTDPMTFAVGAAVLLATAVMAAWVPARRAAGVEVAGVLKGE